MTRIEYLVAHPYEVEKSDIPLLKKEVEKYPYFYTLRALLLYGLKKENHPSFEDYLNKTSIQSSNRVDLYHYINSEPVQKENQAETLSIVEESRQDEKMQKLPESEIISEPIIENFTTHSTQENDESSERIAETTEVKNDKPIIGDENISEIIVSENDHEINDDIVDEMIENDTEESELRTDHVVDIISDEELNEVAEITNKVVKISSISEDTTLDNDIKNAVKQTSGIEIIQSEPEEIIEERLILKNEVHENSEVKKVQLSEKEKDESTFSFSDWLKKVPSQSKSQEEIEEEQEIAEREIKYKLIDDFLEKNPKIVPMKKTDITPASTSSNFVQNTEEYSDLMTETLAQIYIEQKKYDKAIKAYKILILKYPEKNSLFANRIKEIENLKNSK